MNQNKVQFLTTLEGPQHQLEVEVLKTYLTQVRALFAENSVKLNIAKFDSIQGSTINTSSEQESKFPSYEGLI